jgi:M6 family metalloprotease-like protein
MNLGNSSSRRHAALTGVAATALALAGLAMVSTPTQAAPAAAATPIKTGYAGAPVNPAPYALTQPDGSTVRVHDFGDHLQHWTATVKGNYTVVKDGNAWHYASGLTSSGQLKPSNVVAGQGAAPASAKGLTPAPTAQASQHKTPLGGTGDDKELVILVEFNDVTHHSTGSTEADWANHYFGATGSVDDFYDEASQGQFGLAPAPETCGTTNNDGVTSWIHLDMDHPDTGIDPDATEQYVADAIQATADCVDYTALDTNGDGDITTNELHVTIIGAGFETSYGGDECGKSIWGHEWNLDEAGITLPDPDGITVAGDGYTTFGEWHCNSSDDPGHKATMGIMAHEFGHDINWPDLYDTDQSGEGVGEWSLMGSGSWGESTGAGALPGDSPSYPDAYSLYYQHWIEPTPVTTPTDNIAVAAHQSLLLGPNPGPGGTDWLFNEHPGTGEFFMLENRSQHGYDVSTPGCGIVVYRIDETVTPSNGANADYSDPLIKVIQADGDEGLNDSGNRGDDGDPYPGSSGNQDLDNTTTPNSKFHDGTASNLDLHVADSACADTMHVDVTHVGDPSPVVVPPANDNFSDAVALTGDSGTITGNSEHATMETGEPKPLNHGAASVWYNWTPSKTGNATIDMAGSDFDTLLGVYTGSAVNALTLVAANDDQAPPSNVTSKVTTHVTAGTTYQIAADGYEGDSGNIHLAWSLVADAKPVPTVAGVHVAEPSAFGLASSVNVTVSGGIGTPTGSVTVKEGAATIGSGTLDGSGHATVALPATTAAGAHGLTVSYPGDATYAAANGSVSANVNKASSTTSASAPKKVKFKKDFDVNATVAAAGGSNTGTVQVFDGTKLIGTGTLSNGGATIHIKKNLKSGKHTLTVKYLGSANAAASQATVKVKVKKKKHHH